MRFRNSSETKVSGTLPLLPLAADVGVRKSGGGSQSDQRMQNLVSWFSTLNPLLAPLLCVEDIVRRLETKILVQRRSRATRG
jgi:hypothetical protein